MKCFVTGAAVLIAGASAIAPADTTTESHELVKLRDVVVYEDPRFHCAFPSVIQKPDGELICAFRRAPSRRFLWGAPHDSHTDSNSYLVGVRSRDGGETWTSEPQLIYAHAFGGSQDPCLQPLANGDILCASYGWAYIPKLPPSMEGTTFMTSSFGFLGGYLVRSKDGGDTWTGPEYPPTLPDSATSSAIGGPLPAYNRGALLQRADGSLLWAVARSDASKSESTSVHMIRSVDNGKSWNYVSPVVRDAAVPYNETSLIETSAGDIVALVRSERKGGHGAMVRSRDGGQSWLPAEELSFAGHPFHATRLKDEKVFVVYGYRGESPGVRARLVAPDMSDINTAYEHVLRSDGGNPDLGYPWSLELNDGRILVVSYMNVANGPRHIVATLLKRE
ncbi:MAG: sialidase family protein [Candidatus Sumerlaeaceae bacterium]